MTTPIDWTRVEVIAFDLFGTVFELDRPREEIEAYATHIRKPEWSPLVLPEAWGKLRMFDDAMEALPQLRLMFDTVTLSNAPKRTQSQLSCLGWFTSWVLLDDYCVYKPNKDAYVALCLHCRVLPSRILMVSSNAKFGDIETAREVGMQSVLVDRYGAVEGSTIRSLVDLYEDAKLGFKASGQ